MSLFSKLTKASDKAQYPWSRRKLAGSSSALPRFCHATTMHPSCKDLIVYGGTHSGGSAKKDLLLITIDQFSATSIHVSGEPPHPRNYATLLTVGKDIILYGGEPISSKERWDPNFYLFSLRERCWIRLSVKGESPTERSGHSAVVSDDIMYIFGGHNAGSYFGDLLCFNPRNCTLEKVSFANQGPAARSGHAAVVFEKKLYIFGGTDAKTMYNDVWSFDFQSHEWAQITALGFIPGARTNAAVAIVDDVMYIFGGKSSDDQDLGDLAAFRIKMHRWYMFQNMGDPPSARHSATMTVVDDKMIIFGGEIPKSRKEDTSYAYVLDTTKIKYPEPPAQALPRSVSSISSSFSSPDSDVATPPLQPSHSSLQNSTCTFPPRSYGPPQNTSLNNISSSPLAELPIQQPPRPPRHAPIPDQAMTPRITPALSEPTMESVDQALMAQSNSMNQAPLTSPPRPSREGVNLANTKPENLGHQRQTSHQQYTDITLTHPPSRPKPAPLAADAIHDDRTALLREVKARDVVIEEMKKKEQWWRTEVSIARRQRAKADTTESDDADRLMDLSDDPEKLLVFEHLVSVKTELRRLRANMAQSSQTSPDKTGQADRMWSAALQEAAYFKSKYWALKSRRGDELAMTETARAEELEHRLAVALKENEDNSRLLQQLQKRAQHDHSARVSAEERAKEAHARAEEAHDAYERSLEERSAMHTRATRAEAQLRDSAARIAGLTKQLTDALAVETHVEDTSASQLRISLLEAANLKARNESASLKQQLADSMDDIARLRTLLSEREESLSESMRRLESSDIQLSMMRNAMTQRTIATPGTA